MQASLRLRQTLRVLAAVGVTVTGGTIGFRETLHEPWFQAFYRSVVTVTLAGLDTVPATNGAGEHPFLAGDYSIADIATWPWVSRYEWQTVDLNEFPNVKRWYLEIAKRPAVQRGYDVPSKVGELPIPA